MAGPEAGLPERLRCSHQSHAPPCGRCRHSTRPSGPSLGNSTAQWTSYRPLMQKAVVESRQYTRVLPKQQMLPASLKPSSLDTYRRGSGDLHVYRRCPEVQSLILNPPPVAGMLNTACRATSRSQGFLNDRSQVTWHLPYPLITY